MSEDKYKIEELEHRLDQLPEKVREAILSVDYGEKVHMVGKSHGLHLDELEHLYLAIGEVMLGIINPQDFVNNIQDRLGLSTEKARAITKDVNEEIFAPIRDYLQQTVARPETPLKKEVPTREIIEEEHPNIDRETLLREIETHIHMVGKTEPIEIELPAPSLQPKTLSVKLEEKKQETLPPENLPPINEKVQSAPPPPNLPVGEGPKSPMAIKLEQIVRAPKEIVDVTKNSPRKMSDPYREAIG